MNRFIFAITFFTLTATTSLKAQNSLVDFGIEGGPNLSLLTGTTVFNTKFDPKIFASAGFIFQYNTKKFLSFKTGVSYQQKGYQQSITLVDPFGNNAETGKHSSRFDYLTLPILVKATFGKKINFFVNAGPYVGYLLNVTSRYKSPSYSGEQKATNSFNRWDFGISAGLGIGVPINDYWVISLEARNYTGLTNISPFANSNLKTNTTDLRLGVVYRMGFR
ncbi:porin family protein [Fluviicola taffensis]|uniref:Outer membrane protein beta-barrel domain-containing protein n=1 Tax=Fluviicola taffensis (strain DSM 16823 / NCIMB 13979 / RW262) TaxID=755732 RepID=F2IFA3_FLUTR|nr:porin family protein [Fluviicola taffensis]AEA44588.1 hypothetical protein Fluta_2604 [Fluviicola taffensis DSM 16823]